MPRNVHWRQGFDMPEFSGMSWKDLQDVWPIEMRTSSEAYYILGAFSGAWVLLAPLIKEMGIGRLWMQDLCLLAFVSRAEEAKAGLATEYLALLHGVGGGMKALSVRKALITKEGLIENIPAGEYTRAYRVTEKGRVVLREFIRLVDLCHVKMREEWYVDRPEYRDNKPIDNYIKYCTTEFVGKEKPDGGFKVIE